MTGLGSKKYKAAVPAGTGSLNSSQPPSWLQGEAPQPPPRRKKPRIDAGGQLSRFSQRMA